MAGFELATRDTFQNMAFFEISKPFGGFFAPSALNMALTTRLTPYEKIARHEVYRFPVFELAKLDTFQMMAYFEISNRFRW